MNIDIIINLTSLLLAMAFFLMTMYNLILSITYLIKKVIHSSWNDCLTNAYCNYKSS
ncbi:hypothetical protein GCM10007111_21280 [Virgibacillus kapii]|uniref:Uncharacterized protein n=1 Tax=Virgibacillus kapii TaxID=1638645 RepID=A0ABQ2DI47_9BACI|nr:hypothetical protein M948_03830 [Virgibacillus sp. CM-4]GGJ58951.1 hypothetical protein GCM10007111_21280 [Virgibacillus kapii]